MIIKRAKEGFIIEDTTEGEKILVTVLEGKVTVEGGLASPSLGGSFEVVSAGEYEIKGVHIYAYRVNGSIMFLIETESRIKVVFLPKVEKVLSEELTEELSDTDILVTPLSEVQKKIVDQLEPYILIPTNYDESTKKYVEGVSIKSVEKLVLKSHDDLPEELEVVVII